MVLTGEYLDVDMRAPVPLAEPVRHPDGVGHHVDIAVGALGALGGGHAGVLPAPAFMCLVSADAEVRDVRVVAVRSGLAGLVVEDAAVIPPQRRASDDITPECSGEGEEHVGAEQPPREWPRPWWQARIGGAYLSYWLYQHLGNLSPEELGTNELWQRVQEQGDATAVLSDFARQADDPAESTFWSYRRSFGRVRVVVIDSRGGRVLEEGRRRMVNEAEWQWVTESVSGDWDHLVLTTSLPAGLRSRTQLSSGSSHSTHWPDG